MSCESPGPPSAGTTAAAGDTRQWLAEYCANADLQVINWRHRLRGVPLRFALDILWEAAQLVRDVLGPARHFAESRLGLPAGQVEEWHRRAWWGFHASKLCAHRVLWEGKPADVLSLLAPVDWGPLDILRAEGKGVILMSHHFGPIQVLPAALVDAGRASISTSQRDRFQPPTVPRHPVSPTLQVESRFIQALPHLRGQGIALLNLTGPNGTRRIDVNFLGYPLTVSLAAPHLARLSGAPILPVSVIWRHRQLEIVWGESAWIEHDSQDAPFEWIKTYVNWVTHLIQQFPELVVLDRLFVKNASRTTQGGINGEAANPAG